MSKIVCNFIDFVFTNELEEMNQGQIPVLKTGKSWKRIDAVEKPVYQSTVKQNDAGPTNEETVSVKARRSNLTEILIQYCGFHTILRMGVDDERFYVGNLSYPCILEYTSDKVFDHYSFKAISSV
jgi:hypothetical protein